MTSIVRLSTLVLMAMTPSASVAEPPAIWFDRPAETVATAMLLGNGRFATAVLGGTDRERMGVKNNGLWRTSGAAVGKGEVNPLAEADLLLDFPGHKNVGNYRRELDLAAGTMKVSYELEGTRYTRTIFACVAEPLLVVMLNADKPGQLTGSARLTRSADPSCTLLYDSPRRGGSLEFGFSGRRTDGAELIARGRATVNGGQWQPYSDPVLGAGVRFDKADRVVLWIAAGAARGTNVVDLISARLKRAEARGDGLLLDHTRAHRLLFDRAGLSLSGPDRSAMPTDRRLAELKTVPRDPGLAALVYQYERYLAMDVPRANGTKEGNRRPVGPMALALSFWAYWGDGDKAEESLRRLLADFVPFDGGRAATAGINAMLLQVNDATLRPLPAIPAVWPDGEVRGLKGGGDLEVDLRWQQGKLAEMVLRTPVERELRVKLPKGVASMKAEANGNALAVTIENAVATFHAAAGATRIVAE